MFYDVLQVYKTISEVHMYSGDTVYYSGTVECYGILCHSTSRYVYKCTMLVFWYIKL